MIDHARYAYGLRHVRNEMKIEGLTVGETRFPISLTFLAAIRLLIIGMAAVASITFNISPFG